MTKGQRKELRTGKAKYLHVSVQVKAPDLVLGTPAMRTPKGQGRTAIKDKRPPTGISFGKARRQRQRLMRAASEELINAA